MRIHPEEDFLILLYDVVRMMRTDADQTAHKHGLTRTQWVVLAQLERESSSSQHEFAKIGELDPITMVRLVERLETLGLVDRDSDPQDRRTWRLRLAPASAPILRDITRYRARLKGLITKGLDSGALDAMIIGGFLTPRPASRERDARRSSGQLAVR